MALGASIDGSEAEETGQMVNLVLFVVGSAVFYAVTMILMKYWGIVSPLAMAGLVALAFGLGAWCEIEALKIERLSAVYIAILGVECVIISIFSFTILGEQVSLREGAGGALILAGVVIAAT